MMTQKTSGLPSSVQPAATGIDQPLNEAMDSNPNPVNPSHPDMLPGESPLMQDSSEKSASIKKYLDEWNLLYCQEDPDWGELKRRAILGNLKVSRFRSVCWRCLLSVFSPENRSWVSQLRESRAHYARLVKGLRMEPWEPIHSKDHPLSENPESIWNQYFSDQSLQVVIRQDVVRTFPGVEFFHRQSIQDSMVNILFCYARENPAMCYRQGMHEILAPLLFVLQSDHEILLHMQEQFDMDKVIAEVLDPAYLEEDGYVLFSEIMKGIESCYQINDMTPDATGYFPSSPRSPSSCSSETENQVVSQLRWIKDHLLAPHDRQLHDHLVQLDIPLPIFGIRWLRLLFGREFPLQDLLVLWDAIFAEGEKFKFVNYVVVSMLIAIRHQLLDGDYTTCLTYLMRYPEAVDISYIIEHALYLKDPGTHCLPTMTTFANLRAGGRGRAQQQPLPTFTSDLKKYSQPQSVGTLNRLKKSVQSSRWTNRNRSPALTHDPDTNIVDGFTLDDPVVVRAEIQHAHEVMALSRIKLVQYHKVLQRCIQRPDNVDAQHALDGLIELCSLLGSRYRFAPGPMVQVESALEAGEVGLRPAVAPLRGGLSAELPGPPKSDKQLKTFRQHPGSDQPIAGAPLANPIVAVHSESS